MRNFYKQGCGVVYMGLGSTQENVYTKGITIHHKKPSESGLNNLGGKFVGGVALKTTWTICAGKWVAFRSGFIGRAMLLSSGEKWLLSKHNW